MSRKYYEFNTAVHIYGGQDALQKLPDLLTRLGATKTLLISGPVLNKIGSVDIVTKVCLENNINIRALYVEVPNDSSLEVVRNIASVYKVNGCDAILALGGGSVIDTAKGVKLIVSQELTSLKTLMGVNMTAQGKRIPFVVIPTTSGTGSEVTAVSVITDTQRKTKLEFMTPEVLPDACILDPIFTTTLPPRATLLSAFDTLSHAIEAFTCTQKNPLSDSMARLAITSFESSLRSVIERPDDLKARYAMMEVSTLAGIAFSNSMVGGVHAIGHSVGAVYGIGHDQTMALLLPTVMRHNSSVIGDMYGELLYYFAGESKYKSTPADQRSSTLIDGIEELYNELAGVVGAAKSLKELGVDKALFSDVVYRTFHDGAYLLNEKDFDEQEILQILNTVYDGNEVCNG